MKVAGILMAGFGSVLLGYQGAFSPDNTTEGIALVLLSAMLYAGYQVGYAKWIAGDAQTPERVLEWTGLIGASMLFASPLVAAAGISTGYIHGETLDLFLNNTDVQLYVACTCGTTVGFMVLLLLAIYYSSPLLTSAGCVLTIPGSFMLEFLSTGKIPSSMEIGGSTLIAIGFILLTIAMQPETETK
eukprot:CAMPEP_0196593004 /NCGR_PEP_ID=MMETSP1081-20130531/74363_1 /TAXON_ID=36882 /ORGANISM="Pyramimonas amylifera, Strain CCMP720" /LENGTH=186 /DNA_ID=CAMNT_0041916841 /DNA_START=1188 /DNA_END=1748 /DNA_ORIENTATION=-